MQAGDSASCPVLYLLLWWRVGEKYFHVLQKIIMPSFPQDSTKHSSSCDEGPAPRVSWSATVWFITLREETHLTYRGQHKQPSQRHNTPSDISSTAIFSHSSLILAKLKTTQWTQSESNSQTGPCECHADRGVLCCIGHSPSNVNQISCRCSWINDLHQWRALTVNILVSNPTPTLPHCIFSVFLLQIPPLHARCSWRFFTLCHRSVSLFLLLVINTTPQAVARARPCNTTRSSTYFALQAGGGWEGPGDRQSSFYRTTPEQTKEYMSPVGHWKQYSHGTTELLDRVLSVWTMHAWLLNHS